VLCEAVIRHLAPRNGGRYIDGTFGAGGYSEAILAAAECRVWGIDRDPDALALGEALCRRYPGRLALIAGRFGEMEALLASADVGKVDGIALDLGFSSIQVDRPERGFSMKMDGPLDMRMARSGETAADLVNGLPQDEIADIIHEFGEERFARRVAAAIVRSRPILRTAQLAEIVRGAIPKKSEGIDPATRTFQALRIAVNDEMGELRRGLLAAERLLAPGGRLVVVTFHSLEDRPVKAFLRSRSGTSPAGSRHRPETAPPRVPSFRLMTSKAVAPESAEIRANPRARSAKLRAAERTAAPAWPDTFEWGEAA
jgi:16S rRNA (cytosine1402-N4)-methyltransferase